MNNSIRFCIKSYQNLSRFDLVLFDTKTNLLSHTQSSITGVSPFTLWTGTMPYILASIRRLHPFFHVGIATFFDSFIVQAYIWAKHCQSQTLCILIFCNTYQVPISQILVSLVKGQIHPESNHSPIHNLWPSSSVLELDLYHCCLAYLRR